MKEKYSEITTAENGLSFRYNYEDCLLECVDIVDYDYDLEKKEFVEIKLDEWKVMGAIGLREDSWKENPEYWIEQYCYELEQDFSYFATIAEEFLGE